MFLLINILVRVENDVCGFVNIINEMNIKKIKNGKIYIKDIDFCNSLLDVRIFKNKIFRKAVICGLKGRTWI